MYPAAATPFQSYYNYPNYYYPVIPFGGYVTYVYPYIYPVPTPCPTCGTCPTCGHKK